MGWEMPWYTITDAFDADFGVDEWHGTNAFIRDGDRIFRTYFVNSRGDEAMGSTWSYLDVTALGRQEEWEDSPEGYPDPAVRVVEAPRRLRRRPAAGLPRSGRARARREPRRSRMIVAHIAGVPVEETLLPLASGATTAALLLRGWFASRARIGRRRIVPTEDRNAASRTRPP